MNRMRIDVRGLPVGMQEQAAMKMAAELAAKTGQVAECGGSRAVRKVRPKRLRFPSGAAVELYLRLRQAVRDGLISDVRCVCCGESIRTIVIHDGQEHIWQMPCR